MDWAYRPDATLAMIGPSADRSTSRSKVDCLLVIRHGRERTPEALAETLGRLADTLDELDMAGMVPLASASIWRAATVDAEWTALQFLQALEARSQPAAEPSATGGPASTRFSIQERPWLGPPHGPYGESVSSSEIHKEIHKHFEAASGAALVLVGHEPALGWVLDAWTSSPTPPPLESAEIAAFVRATESGDQWHLWWVLTPSAAAAIQELREKVSAKMTSVSLLAGFALAVAVDTLLRMDDADKTDWARALTYGAAALFAVAAVLLVGALLAYDRLMMPPRFWSSRRPGTSRFRWPRHHPTDPLGAATVWRPPSSAGWVIYQETVRIWHQFVHLALVSLALGVALLTTAVALPLGWSDFLTAAVVALIGTLVVLVALHRPVIGVSD
jgi:hypothetical protein